jgi:putative SOS response-associated peptidase YedK
MCGRYVMSTATGDLLSYFKAKEVEGTSPPPTWNVAPTQAVPTITEAGRRQHRTADSTQNRGLTKTAIVLVIMLA